MHLLFCTCICSGPPEVLVVLFCLVACRAPHAAPDAQVLAIEHAPELSLLLPPLSTSSLTSPLPLALFSTDPRCCLFHDRILYFASIGLKSFPARLLPRIRPNAQTPNRPTTRNFHTQHAHTDESRNYNTAHQTDTAHQTTTSLRSLAAVDPISSWPVVSTSRRRHRQGITREALQQRSSH